MEGPPSPRAPLVALLLLLASAVAGALSGPARSSSPVLVKLQYESLCPYCIAFVRDQLAPAYAALGPDAVQVDLVAYGHTQMSDDGSWMKCQHGPRECRGNLLQACALARLSDDNAKQVQVVGCAMSDADPSHPSDTCFTNAGLDVDDISNCAQGQEGRDLIRDMKERTVVPLHGVPNITVNGIWNDDVQDAAQTDLKGLICSLLDQSGLPESCQQ